MTTHARTDEVMSLTGPISKTSVPAESAAQAVPTAPKPFLCRRPVRLTIYACFALLLMAMVAWRYVPIWLDPTFEKHIAEKRVVVGMTKQQVLQAWGGPYTINVTYTKDGLRREEWIYEDWESTSDVKHRYLYFEEGKLLGGWYYASDPGKRAAPPSQKFHDDKALKEMGYSPPGGTDADR